MAHIEIKSSTSIHAEDSTSFLKHHFLYIGNAPNSDMLVIDYSTDACVPGFITHEEWNPWPDDPDELEDPRDFFQPIASSFDSFLRRVVEGRYLPMDYYAAKEFNTLHANDRND